MEGVKKYSMEKDFEAFIYCDKGIYKSIKIFGWNSERSSMLHPKGTWRIFDKEKSNNFPKDFANGKIDTIMGLATLYLHMWKECIKSGGGLLPPFLFSTRVTVGEHSICSRKGKGRIWNPPLRYCENIFIFSAGAAPALRYEIVFSAKVAEQNYCVFDLYSFTV